MKKKAAKRAKGTSGNVDARQFLEGLAGPLTFGGMISSLRLSEELSLAAFAAKLGVSRAYLCDIERGRRNVSPERAAAWAKTLGYSDAQFVRLALQAQLDDAGLDLRVDVSAA